MALIAITYSLLIGDIPWSIHALSVSQVHLIPWSNWPFIEKLFTKYWYSWTSCWHQECGAMSWLVGLFLSNYILQSKCWQLITMTVFFSQNLSRVGFHYKFSLFFHVPSYLLGSFATATCMNCKFTVSCEEIKDEIFDQVCLCLLSLFSSFVTLPCF